MLVAFVDVVRDIPGLAATDDALSDRGCLVPLRCGLGLNRGLFLLPGGLRRLLRGKLAAPRGGALGLLHGRSLEETSNLITGPAGLGCRWLRHVAEMHGGDDDVLAGSAEDWGFARPVHSDAAINVMSSLSSCSAMWMCHTLPLEGLLK
jgi:hypothetical protein